MKRALRLFCLATMVWLAYGNAFGQVTFVEKDGKVMMLNKEGNTVLEFEKSEDFWVFSGDFEDGWGRIHVNGKTGLADSNGWIVEPQDGDLRVYDGFYSVRVLDTVRARFFLSVWSREGKCLLEPMEDVYDWYGNDKILPIKFKGRFGIMDKTGWIVEPKYNEMQWYSEDMLPVREGRQWGFFDAEGRLAIKLQFNGVRRFNEGLAAVFVDSKWGFIDKTGTMVIAPAYDNIDCFFEGLASVEVDGKWGFIDKTGKMVIEPRYDGVGIFSNGLAPFYGDEHLWGFIDKTGKVVIKPQFESPGYFDETDKAWVRIGDYETGVTGYVDRNGNFTPDE